MVRLAFLACLTGSLCSAATFYVGTGGNDKGPGSATTPWATIQHAVDSIQSGDTIMVQAGTYAGCRIENSGKEQTPKVLRTAPGAHVLLNTPGPRNRHQSVIEVESSQSIITDWIVAGFEVANGPNYGIDVRKTNRVTVENNRVHDSKQTGIFTAFSDHVLILNNESWNNGEHGIYQSNSSSYPVIRGNQSHNNRGSGIHMNGDLSEGPPGLIQFATVDGNLIWENGAAGGSGINCDGVDQSTFRLNVLTNNHASGISLYGIDAAHSSSNNKIYGNTIIMAPNSRWVLNIPDDKKVSPPIGNDVQFNILCTPDADRGSIATWRKDVPGFVSDQNVVVDRFSVNDGDTVLKLAQWQAAGYDKRSVTSCDTLMRLPGPR